jgi:hypothetical protein
MTFNALTPWLTLYAWALAALLLIFLFRIARFYQRTAAEPSHYQLFLIPLGLFAGAALRYAWLGQFTGDALGDLLLFAGGLTLFALGAFLSRLMMGPRR